MLSKVTGFSSTSVSNFVFTFWSLDLDWTKDIVPTMANNKEIINTSRINVPAQIFSNLEEVVFFL